jgi:glutamate--cysteine ligase
MIDIFLLHCLLDDSPLDSPNEIAELGRNQQRVASRGREPGLKLERGGVEVLMTDWLREILTECAPIAAWLDANEGTDAHVQALAAARAAVLAPETLPSARVLAQMQTQFGGSHDAFVRAHSLRTRADMLERELPADVAAHMAELATESLAEQARIEAADTMPFEVYRQHYLAPERLRLPRGTPVPAA